MKILLDECIPMALHEHLILKKYHVDHVKQTKWSGFSNSKLYELAQGQYQIFISTDRHFAHPEKFKPKKDFGLIYLRVAPTIGPILIKALDNFLSHNSFEAIIGKKVIVRREDYEIKT